MIQVVIGGVKTVTYLTQGYAVGEQTEYHAHKVKNPWNVCPFHAF